MMKKLPSIWLYRKLFTKMNIAQKLIIYFLFCKKQLIVNTFSFHVKAIVKRKLFRKKKLGPLYSLNISDICA